MYLKCSLYGCWPCPVGTVSAFLSPSGLDLLLGQPLQFFVLLKDIKSCRFLVLKRSNIPKRLLAWNWLGVVQAGLSKSIWQGKFKCCALRMCYSCLHLLTCVSGPFTDCLSGNFLNLYGFMCDLLLQNHFNSKGSGREPFRNPLVSESSRLWAWIFEYTAMKSNVLCRVSEYFTFRS